MSSRRILGMCKQAFDQLVSTVEQGRSDQLKAYLAAMGHFHRYSINNAVLIAFHRPGATHVAGFHAWRKLGRHVKKNERGIAIMAPVIRRQKGRQQEDDKKNEDDETVLTFKTAYVWDVTQTDGQPLPEFARVSGDPGVCTERLRQFAQANGIEIQYSDRLGSAEGISTGKLIRLRSDLGPAEEFSVLVHELAHSLLHFEDDRPKDRMVREAEAEGTAFVVSQGCGLEVGTASSDYIQLYNGDKATLLESLERIQQTASRILAAILDEKPRAHIIQNETTDPVASLAEAA